MLLTLDLATSTGWTRAPIEDKGFAFGTHKLPKTDDIGRYLSDFRYWLHGQLDGCTACYFEAPILPRQTKLITCRKLYGLAGVAQMACLDYGIKSHEVNPQTLKAFMGAGYYGKQDMIRAVRLFGFHPATDDEADAIALRLYAIHILNPKNKFNLAMGQLGAVS